MSLISQIVDPASYTLSLAAVPTFITAVALLVVSMAAVVRERGSAVSFFFLLFAVTASIWLFATSLMYGSTSRELALWWQKAAYVGVPLIPAAIYNFSVVVLRIYRRRRLLVAATWVLSVLFCLAAVGTDALIGDLYHYWWGYYAKYSWLSIPFLTFFFGMMVVSLLEYRVQYREAKPGSTHHRRIASFLVAFLIAYVGSVDYLPKFGIPIYPFGYLPIALFVFLSARAIWRYRLVDITPAFAAREIIGTMNEALLVLDDEGVIRLANRAACETLGQDEDALVGRPLEKALGHAPVSPLLVALAEAGTLRDYEVVYEPASGARRVLSLSASVMRDPYERPVAVVCVARDVTEQRAAAESLRRYARRLEAMHDIDRAILAREAPQALAHAALARLRHLVPCQGVRIVLCDAERGMASVVAADGAGSSAAADEGQRPIGEVLLCNGAPRTGVCRFADLAQDGGELPQLAHLAARGVRSVLAVSLRNEDVLLGELDLYALAPGAFEDEHVEIASEVASQLAIAVRDAHLHIALEVEQQRLQGLVGHLPEGVLLLDGEQRVLVANPVAREYLRLLGATDVDGRLRHLAGVPIADLAARSAAVRWHELRLDGAEPRVFEAAARSLQVADGELGLVLVLRDVTTERMMQSQLQHQERLAAIGQLAAGIGHDFNNLLASIIGFAEVLKARGAVTGHARLYVDTILQQGYRASDLVNQILDFSSQSLAHKQPLDLVAAIKELTVVFCRTIPENIRVGFECEVTACWTHADPTQFQQMLTNLVVNARDAMPHGGVLTIRLVRFELPHDARPPYPGMAPGNWVRIEVADTGTGIAPEVVPRIFEPFFTTKGRTKGTGLGLAQVYGLVQQHDGHVDVHSAPGLGTTFRVYLPALEAREITAPEPVPALDLGAGELVLLVEDDPTVLGATRAMLEELGYRVLVAADGKEALAVYEEHGPAIALVLTDLVMPHVGGADLFRTLRASSPAVKVIVATGYAEGQEAKQLLQQGVVDWVQKPLSLARLAQVVRRALVG